jgi:hypothetical protein
LISDVAGDFIAMGHDFVDVRSIRSTTIADLPLERLNAIGTGDAVFVAITYDETIIDQLARRFEVSGVKVRFDGRLLPPPNIALPPFYILRTVRQRASSR